MFKKFKMYIASFVVVLSLFSFTALSPSNSFGKKFNVSKDFTCCKGSQLYIHHFYTYHLFGVKVNSGYTEEAIGKATDGCNIQCLEK